MRGPRNRDAHMEPAFTLRVRGDEFALCEEPATAAFIPGPAPDEIVKYRTPQNELQEMLRGPCPSWSKRDNHKSLRKASIPTLRGTRRITIREQARLQTFPDWVTFKGRTTSQARQIGNAVPPLFAFQLFRQIFKHL
jgi:site-specific DNA-cytosine methylase